MGWPRFLKRVEKKETQNKGKSKSHLLERRKKKAWREGTERQKRDGQYFYNGRGVTTQGKVWVSSGVGGGKISRFYLDRNRHCFMCEPINDITKKEKLRKISTNNALQRGKSL